MALGKNKMLRLNIRCQHKYQMTANFWMKGYFHNHDAVLRQKAWLNHNSWVTLIED